MALYLEQYLDNLQSLPGEVQRNLRLIRELDEKVNSAMTRVDYLGTQYAKEEDKLSAQERRQRKDEIQTLLNKSKAWGEQKWQISMQLYEMVDKHIRRLDSELARFERELKRKVIHAKLDFVEGAQSSAESTIGSERKGGKSQQQGKGRSAMKGGRRRQVSIDESSASENAPPSKKAKKKKKSESDGAGGSGPLSPMAAAGVVQPLSPGGLGVEQLAELSGAALIQQLVGVGAGVMDMPVDPNEPVYCTCRQVSYGEMVGCDNPDCPIEWFHFGCVGITSKPKGKWFCPMCKDSMKKKVAGSS